MIRLFAAIRPPADVRDALIDTMEGLDSARWQSDEQLHLTLRFIGDVERPVAEDVATALSAIRFAPFSVSGDGVGTFDRKGRATALWARIDPSPPLIELQQRVEGACRRAGLDPEPRKFVPHMTIARLGNPAGDIGGWLARHARLRVPPFEVGDFRLCQSTLSRHGSVYHDIARFG